MSHWHPHIDMVLQDPLSTPYNKIKKKLLYNLANTKFSLPTLFMAITALCSSPTYSPTVPTISFSSLSSTSSLKTHLSPQPYCPLISASTPNSVSFDTLAIAELAETAEAWGCRESENGLELNGDNGLTIRRKGRKKRRGLTSVEVDEEKMGEEQRVLSGSSKSRNLSSREEAELCQCLKEGTQLEMARKRAIEAQEHEITAKQLAKAAGKKIRTIDKIFCEERESRERIIRCYRRLVVSVASAYQGKGLSLQDLIQEGSIGLLRGAEKYDPDRGYKLSTYVYWWIRQAIIRSIAKKSRLVRLPGNMCQMVTKIAEAKNMLRRKHPRPPTYEEIAQVLDIDVTIVRLISEKSKLPFSLNQPVTDRGFMTLQEIMPGPDELMPEKMVMKQVKKQEVEKLLKTLSKREAEILRLYYGLDGHVPLSFEEIGKILKLSRERVRQINLVALSKLRKTNVQTIFKFS